MTVSVVSTSVLGCGNTNAVPTSGICTNTGPHNIGIGIGILAANAADIDDPEDSDGEISKIDFRGVNLRSKKKRDVSGNQNGDKIGDGDANGDGGGCCDGNDNSQQQPERPMSWEGELSDQEMSSNTITDQVGFLFLLCLCERTFGDMEACCRPEISHFGKAKNVTLFASMLDWGELMPRLRNLLLQE